MAEVFVRELLSLCLHRIAVDENTNSELEFIQVVKNYEALRKRWLQAELELRKNRELLLKSDLALAASDVKLKHARNQVDVEIKKRYKAEADYQFLERQMQLICDILVHDSKSSACLNDEQRSILANFNHRGANVTQQKSRRLSVIDESSFLFHSDVSYDRSEDDLDLGTPLVKPLRSRVREKRRSSMGPAAGLPVQKRGRISRRSGDPLGDRPGEKEVETTVVKASVTTPEGGGQIHMVIDITPDKAPKTTSDYVPSVAEQTSVWGLSDETNTASEVTEVEETAKDPVADKVLTLTLNKVLTPAVEMELQHVFQSKTVIRPEMCLLCGKRIRFGKMALKCRDCRLVAHPDCKHLCPQNCTPSITGPLLKPNEDSLEHFAPATQPRIPLLIVQCVSEIEKRGLEERGIYRVPGGERMVKELRERHTHGKGPLLLSKVDEIHVVCGLLKDFLRKLREPLVTFRLHRTFMEACELDDEKKTEVILQAIEELPQPNRDTLAFLMLHLQKVMASPLCQMDQNNLARVFGPTVVGHGIPEPSPMTIMKDTNAQPKVISRMLSFPSDYWKRLLLVERDRVISSVVDANLKKDGNSADRDRLFKPLTSPELRKYPKTPASVPLKGKLKNLGTAFNSTGKTKTDASKRKFFTSPN